MAGNLEALIKYFSDQDLDGAYTLRGELGNWVPSDLDVVNAGLELLLKEGIIDPSRLFLDAGGGDGRIVFLTAGIHGIPSTYVDIDSYLADEAERNYELLKRYGIINGNPEIKLLRGDFTQDQTYAAEGIRFEDFPVIYNYDTKTKEIARKIESQSPEGTILIVLRHPVYSERSQKRFRGLITLKDNVIPGMEPFSMRVYIKHEKEIFAGSGTPQDIPNLGYKAN